MDEDVKAARAMVAKKEMTWLQICDGKAFKSELTKLFNGSTPKQFVLDRQGKIAAKPKEAKELEKVVAEALTR